MMAQLPNTRPSFRRNRVVILLILALVFVFAVTFSSRPEVSENPVHIPEGVKSKSTKSFRDNLLPTEKYITTWPYAGWTNNVIIFINLIYLGLLTDRIPILPPFSPSHHIQNSSYLQVGEVFDLPRLSAAIGTSVLEWSDVKDPKSQFFDSLGCWSTRKAQFGDESHHDPSTEMQQLDISYTPAPMWIKKFEYWSTFSDLQRLGFPETRSRNLDTPVPSPRNVSLPPDEHLLCFDALYFVCDAEPFDHAFDYIPQWRHVGRHMHWTLSVVNLGRSYVNLALGLAISAKTPPYIAIHARRDDFEGACQLGQSLADCFPTMAVIKRRVEEVRIELRETKGLDVKHIVMTSDEKDPKWWGEVLTAGWLRIDHARVEKLHGPWYPTLIDAVIQSTAAGFVGTDRSTFSILAMRRGKDWHGQVSRIMRWGDPTSDDH